MDLMRKELSHTKVSCREMWISLSLGGLPGGNIIDAIEKLVNEALDLNLEESAFQEAIDQVKK
jgi:hypothetical protein